MSSGLLGRAVADWGAQWPIGARSGRLGRAVADWGAQWPIGARSGRLGRAVAERVSASDWRPG